MASREKAAELLKHSYAAKMFEKLTAIILEKILYDYIEVNGKLNIGMDQINIFRDGLKKKISQGIEALYMENYTDEEADFMIKYLSDPLQKRVAGNENRIASYADDVLDEIFLSAREDLAHALGPAWVFQPSDSHFQALMDLKALAANMRTGNPDLPFEQVSGDIERIVTRLEIRHDDLVFDLYEVCRTLGSSLEFLKKCLDDRGMLELLYADSPAPDDADTLTASCIAQKVLKEELGPAGARELISQTIDYCQTLFECAGIRPETELLVHFQYADLNRPFK